MDYNEGYKDEVDSYFDDGKKQGEAATSSDFEDFLKYMAGSGGTAATGNSGNTQAASARELVLDLDSPLESFFTGMIIMSVIGIVGILFSAMGKSSLLQWIYIPIVTLIISIILRTNTDEYYILDANSQEILFRRKFFGNERKNPVANFSDIFAATTAGNLTQTKHSKYWSYSALFVLKDARTIRITDYMKENFENAKAIARKAADFLKIPYRPGTLETYTMIELDKLSGEPKLSFVDHFTYIMKTRLIWYLLSITFFVTFFIFIMHIR